jgi:hypothetical protein
MLGETTSNRRTSFLKYMDEYGDAQSAVGESRGLVKDVRRRMQPDFDLSAFDLVRRLNDMQGDRRMSLTSELGWMMAQIDKPIVLGDDSEPVPGELSAAARASIEEEGFAAGRNNWVRDLNRWNPGSEQHQIWDSGWLRGRDTLEHGSGEAPAPKRPRGRPKGSRSRTNGAAGHA